MMLTADIPPNLLSLDRVIGWLRRIMTAALLVQLGSGIAFWFFRNPETLVAMVACMPILFATIVIDWSAKAAFRKRLIGYWVSLGMGLPEARELYAERYW